VYCTFLVVQHKPQHMFTINCIYKTSTSCGRCGETLSSIFTVAAAPRLLPASVHLVFHTPLLPLPQGRSQPLSTSSSILTVAAAPRLLLDLPYSTVAAAPRLLLASVHLVFHTHCCRCPKVASSLCRPRLPYSLLPLPQGCF
jgi:hypothetical protein